MRVHTMLTALALVCLGLQASAYTIQVQTVPLALQGVWVNLANAKQRHAACKTFAQQKVPQKAAYFIAISSAELRHSYRGNTSTLLAHELMNSRFLPHSLSGLSPQDLPLIQGKLGPKNTVRELSYRYHAQNQSLSTPHLAVKTFYRCPNEIRLAAPTHFQQQRLP